MTCRHPYADVLRMRNMGIGPMVRRCGGCDELLLSVVRPEHADVRAAGAVLFFSALFSA